MYRPQGPEDRIVAEIRSLRMEVRQLTWKRDSCRQELCRLNHKAELYRGELERQ